MARSSDPFKNINWQTAPALHDLSVSVGEHFSDARAGQPLATNELVEDCMSAFKALGIVPQTIIVVMNSVYGLNPAPKQPEVANPAPLPPPAPKQSEPVAVLPEKKGTFFNR